MNKSRKQIMTTKTKIFIAASLLIISMTAQAQEERKVEANSASMSVGFSISSSPKLEIGADKLTFSNNANSVNFSADERVVIRLRPANQNGTNGGIKGDMNGDGILTISDISELVKMILKK